MNTKLLSTSLGRLRIIAFAEGISYLLLGVTMILKYGYDMPQPNYVVGMAHGVLFLVYVILLGQVALTYKWSWIKTSLAFLASLIPLGTFWAEIRLFRDNTSKL